MRERHEHFDIAAGVVEADSAGVGKTVSARSQRLSPKFVVQLFIAGLSSRYGSRCWVVLRHDRRGMRPSAAKKIMVRRRTVVMASPLVGLSSRADPSDGSLDGWFHRELVRVVASIRRMAYVFSLCAGLVWSRELVEG
jgi:hypothetical protein